jgi:hypothetical protein
LRFRVSIVLLIVYQTLPNHRLLNLPISFHFVSLFLQHKRREREREKKHKQVFSTRFRAAVCDVYLGQMDRWWTLVPALLCATLHQHEADWLCTWWNRLLLLSLSLSFSMYNVCIHLSNLSPHGGLTLSPVGWLRNGGIPFGFIRPFERRRERERDELKTKQQARPTAAINCRWRSILCADGFWSLDAWRRLRFIIFAVDRREIQKCVQTKNGSRRDFSTKKWLFDWFNYYYHYYYYFSFCSPQKSSRVDC